MRTPTPTFPKVTVVGAGFSGLTAAYALRKAGFDVEVLERDNKAGGLIATATTPWGPAETAANGLLNSIFVEQMAADIGVPMMPTRKESSKRFIVRKNKARRWPLGTRETLKSALTFATRSKRAPAPFETVAAWGTRVFGRANVDNLIGPALQGIYAGDPERMSASLVFGRFFDKAARAASAKNKSARRGTVAPRRGMGELITGLRHWLRDQGVLLRFGVDVRFAELNGPVVLALSAHEAAAFLNDAFPEEAAALADIEMLGLRTTTLYFPKDQSRHPVGFGCLFPRTENYKTLGVLYPTEIFENRGMHHAETWILRDDPQLSDGAAVRLILDERKRFLGQELIAFGSFTKRWPHALPHYTVELEQLLKSGVIEKLAARGVILHGNYLGRLGLGSLLERSMQIPPQVLAAQLAQKAGKSDVAPSPAP